MSFSPAILRIRTTGLHSTRFAWWRKFSLTLLVLANCEFLFASGFTLLERLEHQPALFTQGLEYRGETLYESSGGYGHSLVFMQNGSKKQGRKLDKRIFAEGLTLTDSELLLLTWRSGVVFRLDPLNLTAIGQWRIDGEAWGICHAEGILYISNGSAQILKRSSEDFSDLGVLNISEGGKPIDRLNELECAKGYIWSNIWRSEDIVAIDPNNGKVMRRYELGGIVKDIPRANREAVMNGIAWHAASDSFLITGKLWPQSLRVKFELPEPAREETEPTHSSR